MRKISLILTLVLVSFSYCSAQRKKTDKKVIPIAYTRSGNVEFDNYNKGLLSVTTKQGAENLEKAIYYSEINALENILFKGIPGSPQEHPLIKEEKREPFLDKLIFDRDYEKFLTNSEVLETYKSEKMISVRQRVTFDIEALRKELEKNNIIRKFGL